MIEIDIGLEGTSSFGITDMVAVKFLLVSIVSFQLVLLVSEKNIWGLR